MIKNADLISYLPQILQDVREYKAIAEADNPEFQLVFDTSEKVLNNLYIQTGDVDGITRYEKILGIRPSVNDTLETRRFRVLSRWSNRIPYTWKSLVEKIDSLCGEDNYTLELLNNLYRIDLETHLGVYGSIDELKYMLEKMIPANIEVLISNVLLESKQTDFYYGSAVVSSIHYTIT